MSDLTALRAEAQACYERGDLNGALAMYLRLHEMEPQSAEVLNDLGTVCVRLGRWGEGMRYYARALRLDPQHKEATENLRMACRASGTSLEAALKEGGSEPSAAGCGPAPSISVVVPVTGPFDTFDQCLDALHSQTFAAERYEVLAVANGVSGTAAQELGAVVGRWQRSFWARLRLLDAGGASIPRARNEGIAHARGEVVMQINQDTALSRTALAQHYAEHEGFGLDRRCVVVGGRKFGSAYLKSLFNYLHESLPLYTPLDRLRPRFLGDHTWSVTCNHSCLREAYERFGLYDPSYAWGSDQETARRWERGHQARIYVNTNIVSYHLHWMSFDGWRNRCIEATPSWFKRHMGMLPEGLPPEGRQAVRDKLDAQEPDMSAVVEEVRRLERSWSGPEDFRGEMILGVPVTTLAEFNGRLRRLLTDYRTHVQYTELWKRIESVGGVGAAGICRESA